MGGRGQRFPMDRMIGDIKLMKVVVLDWEKDKKRKMQEEILEIEEKVEELLFNYSSCIFKEDEKRKLGDLKG